MANSKDIRDKFGNYSGRIDYVSTDRVELRDRNGNLRGTYNPKLDETRDNVGNLQGRGDWLMTLL